MASDCNLKSDQGDLPALREVFLGFSKATVQIGDFLQTQNGS